MIGLGFGISLRAGILGDVVEQIITAATAPGLAPVITSDDPPEDALAASATDIANYSSTAGTITSAVATWNVDETALHPAGTVVSVSILVTDSTSETRTFGPYSRTIVDVVITADTPPFLSPAVDGNLPVNLINYGTYSGTNVLTVNLPTVVFSDVENDFSAPTDPNTAVNTSETLDARITVTYETLLNNIGLRTFDMDAVTVQGGAAPVVAGNFIAPINLRQGSGNWTYPLFQTMPRTDTPKTYSIVNGTQFATVDASGVVTIDTTNVQNNILLTLQATEGGNTYYSNHRIVIETEPAADHTFATQAEFDALTIASGDIVELTAPMATPLVIDGVSDFILRSASEAARFEGIRLINTIDDLTVKHANIESRVWPSHGGYSIDFDAASTSNLKFQKSRLVGLYEGTTFWDTSDRDLPVYDVHRFSGTATTTPTDYTIPWDAFAETDVSTTSYIYRLSGGGEVNFQYLDDTDTPITVQWKVNNVTVTGSSRPIDVTYVSGNPPTITSPTERPVKVRVWTTSGTAEFGTKTYQLVDQYMSNFMGRTTGNGTSSADGLEVTDCFASGWNNLVKPQTGNEGLTNIRRNKFYAIYQDVKAMRMSTGSSFDLIMNEIQQQFYHRNGLEWLDICDPGDPHGDVGQMFGGAENTVVSEVNAWGNIMFASGLRGYSDQVAQAFMFPQHVSDNPANPEYEQMIITANFVQGPNNLIGATGRNIYIAQNIGMHAHASTQAAEISAEGSVAYQADALAVVIGNVSQQIENNTPGVSFERSNYEPTSIAEWQAAFTNYDASLVANDWGQMDAALTPVLGQAAEGMGPVGVDAINWDTETLNWANLPMAISFAEQINVDVSTLVTSEVKNVCVGDVTRSITPDGGVEWRWAVLGADITLEAWLTGAGDVTAASGDLFVQMQVRHTTAATGLTDQLAGLNVGGVSIGGMTTRTLQVEQTIFDFSTIATGGVIKNGVASISATPELHTLSRNGGGTIRAAYDVSGVGLVQGETYVWVLAVYGTDAAQTIAARSANNSGFTSGASSSGAIAVSTDSASPTIIPLEFTYNGGDYFIGMSGSIADGETITMDADASFLQTKFYYDNPPLGSLVDFAAITPAEMDENFRVTNSDTPNNRTATISASGTAYSSYPMAGLTSGTNYTVTAVLSADVAQTLNIRVSSSDSALSANIIAEQSAVAISTDDANPTTVVLTFTATANTPHVGFRGAGVAGNVRLHAVDWSVVAT